MTVEMGAAVGGSSATSKRAFPLVVAAAVAFHVAVLGLMLTRRFDWLFNDAEHRIGPGTDFLAYFNAGTAMLHGESPYGRGPGFGFRYHPLTALLLSPLTLLRTRYAYAAWVLGTEGVLGAWLVWVWRQVDLPQRRELVLLTLVCAPLFLELYMGNATFLAAVPAALAVHAFVQQRTRAGTTWLFLSLLAKPISLVLLPWLVFRREWRAYALVVGGAFVVTALPFLALFPDTRAGFLAMNVRAVGRAGWVCHGGNQGLHALVVDAIARGEGLPTATLASIAQLGAVAALLLYAWPWIFSALACVGEVRHGSERYVTAFLWFSVYLLGFKDVWEHSYAMVPVLAVLLALAGYLTRLRWALIVLLALPTAFALYDVALPDPPNDPEHSWGAAVALVHHATRSVPMLALWLSVLLAPPSARSPRATSSRPALASSAPPPSTPLPRGPARA